MLTLLVLLSAAQAESLVGDFLTLDYNAGGTWNNATAAVGYAASINGSTVDFTYAGIAYQAWGVDYLVDGEDLTYQANSGFGDTIYVKSGTDVSTPGVLAYTWVYTAGNLVVEKTEWFNERDISLGVQFTLTNVGASPVDDLILLYTFDPDQDAAAYADYNTLNDVEDSDDDGGDDWASARGATSDLTIGIGSCDPALGVLGFNNAWGTETVVAAPLLDTDGASADNAIALQYFADRSIPPGGELSFRFVVAADATGDEARDTWLALAPDVCCDGDGDFAEGPACGGPDCDDSDGTLSPAAVDVPYDGIDQDCSGSDNADLDGDGAIAVEAGGPDCDDADPLVNGAQSEVWYDGIDQNCDGNDDDQDGDGATLAYDCDDEDSAIQVDCPEPVVDDGAVQTSDGCGCASGSAGAGAVAMTVGAGLTLRRRRR